MQGQESIMTVMGELKSPPLRNRPLSSLDKLWHVCDDTRMRVCKNEVITVISERMGYKLFLSFFSFLKLFISVTLLFKHKLVYCYQHFCVSVFCILLKIWHVSSVPKAHLNLPLLSGYSDFNYSMFCYCSKIVYIHVPSTVSSSDIQDLLQIWPFLEN